VYDVGTGADTTYNYDTTSGQLTHRDFPTVSSHWIRTAYSYDAAGRLEYETVTNESGGTTDLYKTPVAATFSRRTARRLKPPLPPAGEYVREVQRTEQTYSGGWVNDNRLTYCSGDFQSPNRSAAKAAATGGCSTSSARIGAGGRGSASTTSRRPTTRTATGRRTPRTSPAAPRTTA
jgi:YD repeat-containing protein